MTFPPRPENDFHEFIRTYYETCRHRFPKIEAVAGKWMYRDLLPGMSDFDTRFICSDDMSVDDWCEMSEIVGKAHLEICETYPCWARNLEHLPGVNLTWEELGSEKTYYPEYRQWTFYHTTVPERMGDVLDTLGQRNWGTEDEYFHLKKFCLYYGRYDREIDPPVNLGAHVGKYGLHSRIMHYFNPPVMAAMCLLLRHPIKGKLDAFDLAAERFSDLDCWDMVREILHAGYETPRWYAEQRLVELEDALETALQAIAQSLPEVCTLIPPSAGTEVARWKQALAEAPLDPALVIFDNAKFSRLMKGRLHFYCDAPAHFDATWPVQNELLRLGQTFFRVPFATYWRIRTGEIVADPVTILDRLRGDPLTNAEVDATREFARLTPGTWEPGSENQVARAIIDVFDDFYRALARISASV